MNDYENCFVFSEHKTFLDYGATAKYAPPGLKQAVSAYLDLNLPGELFLYNHQRRGKLHIFKLLRDSAKIFGDGQYQLKGSTLMRKYYETRLDAKEATAAELEGCLGAGTALPEWFRTSVATYDCHQVRTANMNYNTNRVNMEQKIKKAVSIGRAAFKLVMMKDPEEWCGDALDGGMQHPIFWERRGRKKDCSGST